MASNLYFAYDTDYTLEMFNQLGSISTRPPSSPETEDDVPITDADGTPLIVREIEIKRAVAEPPLVAKETEIKRVAETPLTPDLGPDEDTFDEPPPDTEEANVVFVVPTEVADEDEMEEDKWILTPKFKLMVIVSMVAPFGDDTLLHAGDFEIEVTPSTTIREIKYGITSRLDICYEDMALVFVGKFLSDARTIEYYLIGEGQSLHLLVETPNKLFKDVFNAFKKLDLSEERAWFATRSFIHVMHTKYRSDGLGNDETPVLTEELLLQELEQLHVPDSDESDDSSADEDEPEVNNPNDQYVYDVYTSEGEEYDENEEPEASDEEDDDEDQDESEDEDEDEDEDEVSDIDEEDEGEDSDFYPALLILQPTLLGLFE